VVLKATIALFFGTLAVLGVLYVLRAIAFNQPEIRITLAWISQALVLAFVVGLPVGGLSVMRRMRAIRSEERRRHPELFRNPRDQIGSSAGEFRSRWTFLGVPLVHVRFSTPDKGEPPVFAWVAGGDRAYGLLIAWGGCAIAPISVGVFAVGFFALGTVSLGFVSLGTAAVGLLAIGCMSAGVNSYAWLSALGWESAQGGGFSIARVAAEGPVAFAQHANDAVAHQILANPNMEQTHMIFLIVIAVLSIVPIAFYARAVRQRLGRTARSDQGEPQ
jgi:hypothetical protein